ncbi:hypothetical protein KFE25_010183 [Diacronema lutheri]|uniref:Uncharacterized protein n=1 Tax=Diacronema lutheri TaxID=2081491 RepID=A0A8J5XSV7_DIALT|nr:hypothetical protein KFE25_010183 [Diacronema lutheri]
MGFGFDVDNVLQGAEAGGRKKGGACALAGPARSGAFEQMLARGAPPDDGAGVGGTRKKPRTTAPASAVHARKAAAKLIAPKAAAPSPAREDDEDELSPNGSPESPETPAFIANNLRKVSDLLTAAGREAAAEAKKKIQDNVKAMKKTQDETAAKIGEIARATLEEFEKVVAERDKLREHTARKLHEAANAYAAELNKKLGIAKSAAEKLRAEIDGQNKHLADVHAQSKATLFDEVEQALAKHKAEMRVAHADAALPSHEVFEVLDKQLGGLLNNPITAP